MTTKDYIVLKGRRGRPTMEPFSLDAKSLRDGPFVGASAIDLLAEAEMSVQNMALADVRDAARDPSTLSLAPKMPIALIEPREVSAADAAASDWGIRAVKADVSKFTGANVVVAVLDTGIDASHPAFAGVTLEQKDFTGLGNGDENGHGTHCAGTIFGRDMGDVRIGVARGVTKALIGRVLDKRKRGSSEMLFKGMNWASESGAHVLSLSLGFDFPGMVANLIDRGMTAQAATSDALVAYRGNLRMFDAIMAQIKAREAFGSSMLVVAASGNESDRPKYEIAASLPAAADGVVAVGALAESPAGLEVAPFSNTLPQVSAPGVNIASARMGGGLRLLSGTSMACPHVAGVAALWYEALARQPVFNMLEALKARLLGSTRTDVFAPSVDVADRGNGIVTAP